MCVGNWFGCYVCGCGNLCGVVGFVIVVYIYWYVGSDWVGGEIYVDDLFNILLCSVVCF